MTNVHLTQGEDVQNSEIDCVRISVSPALGSWVGLMLHRREN
jgi:hypothetical protein